MARVTAHALIDAVFDAGSFQSWDVPLPDHPSGSHPVAGVDPAPGYVEQLARARERSGTDESILTGSGMLAGQRVALIAGEFDFLAGSIGRAASERIVLAFERAAREGLPILASPTSGGTRMQEGTRAFLQLLKISQSILDFRRTGAPYLVYVRHPMTGGPVVSWGSLGQVTFAEPDALIGLLGPRVCEVLTGARLDEGVQSAENLAEQGIIDGVVPLAELRGTLLTTLGILAAPRVGAQAPSSLGAAAATARAPDKPPAWHSITATSSPARTRLADLIEFDAESYVPLLGTGAAEYRGGVRLGLARFEHFSCMLIGHTHHGPPGDILTFPGLAVIQRGVSIASELDLPIVTVIDTAGAEITAASEARGMAREIARTVEQLIDASPPVVSVILGAGTGVSALTLLPADRTVCAEHAWLAPLPLEAASEILHRSTEHAAQVAQEQGIRAEDLVEYGLVNEIVPESPPGHEDPAGNEDRATFRRRLVRAVGEQLRDLLRLPDEERRAARRQRYRRMN